MKALDPYNNFSKVVLQLSQNKKRRGLCEILGITYNPACMVDCGLD